LAKRALALLKLLAAGRNVNSY